MTDDPKPPPSAILVPMEHTGSSPTGGASNPELAVTSPGAAAARLFAIDLARHAHDLHCTDVVVLDVRGLSQLTDFLVIATGTSDRQMHTVLDQGVEMGRRQGHEALRVSVDARSVWLVADFVDVVFHVFEPQTRAYYDLEMLWGDAPRVEWARDEQRNLAGLSPGDVPPRA